MRKLILPVCAFFILVGTASAAQMNTNINGSVRWGGPAVVPADSLEGNGNGPREGDHPMPFNPDGPMHPATTSQDRPYLWHASSTMPMQGPVVPGTVASVSANSFTMTAPFGKDHATTTLTVNVSSTTMFMHASSTESLSNLSVGSHVLVFGKISTTTQSIAAEHIIVTGDLPPKAKSGIDGILEHLKEFFLGKHASTTNAVIQARGAAAASVGSGFIGNVVHTLLGWF